MHMPQNYLSPSTCIILGLVFLALFILAIIKTKRTITSEKLILLGFASAISFLITMLSVPISGGTSSHAVCAALIAILFGPWAAVLAITAALFVQSVLFGYGGIFCLGANCLTMAFVLPFIAYGIYWLFSQAIKGLRGELLGCAVGSYIAMVITSLLSAIICSLQPLFFHDSIGNALYAPYPLTVAIPSILANHLALWGIVEAVVSTLLLFFFRKYTLLFPVTKKGENKRKEKLREQKLKLDIKNMKPVIILTAALSIFVPLVSFFVHNKFGTWSIERLSANIGYTPSSLENAQTWPAPFQSYTIAVLPQWLSYILSGIIGVALLIGVFKLASLCGKADKNSADAQDNGAKVQQYDEYIYEIDD